MRARILFLASLMVLPMDPASGAALGDDRTPTSVTITISTAIEKLQVGGDLTPDHFGDIVRIAQFKRKNERWKRVAKKEVVMEDFGTAGDFVTTFELFNGGRCKIKVRFPGDDDHQPSSSERKYRCDGDDLEGPARI